jgi:hypothetical protein
MILKYLWYKLYRACLKWHGETAWLAAGVPFSFLITINIMVIDTLFAKLDVLPSIFGVNRMEVILGGIVLVLSWVYFSGKRAKKIIDRFSEETEKQRENGWMGIILYIFLSMFFLIVVSFYKPGYVPTW